MTDDLFSYAEQSRYPHAPGSRGTDTSEAAATSVASEAGALRARCLAVLKSVSATADEVASTVGRTVLSIRSRIAELKRLGLIRDTGTRRANESGRTACVWRAVQ